MPALRKRCGAIGTAGAGRRGFLRALFAGWVALAFRRPALAEDEKPGADERPKPGDLFVHAEGDSEGKIVGIADIPLGGPPLQAWPMDPGTKVVRDGSRLNQVLLLRLDPASLDEILKVRYRGCRYAFGYPACPDLEDRAKVMRLLQPERIGVVLSEEFQLAPEQSTDALIAHHPEANYFST